MSTSDLARIDWAAVAIVRAATELPQGSVTAESRPSATRFELSFPAGNAGRP